MEHTGKDYNVSQHQMCLTFLKVKLVCLLLQCCCYNKIIYISNAFIRLKLHVSKYRKNSIFHFKFALSNQKNKSKKEEQKNCSIAFFVRITNI